MRILKEKIWNPLKGIFGNKKVKIWTIVVSAVLVVVMITSVILCNIYSHSGIVYLKDDVLMYGGLLGEPQTIESANRIAREMRINKTHTRLFSLERDPSGSQRQLFYRQLNKPNSKRIQISFGNESVSCFNMNENGTAVAYIQDGKLYYSDLKKTKEIANDVHQEDWDMSLDGKRVVWRNREGTAYVQTIGKKAEKIDSNVTKFVHISDDCKTVWYMTEDGDFYTKDINQKKVKLASDIWSVAGVYDSGKAYFVKQEAVTWNWWEYVEDDLKETDASMTEPQKPNGNDFIYMPQGSYDKAVNEYKIAKQKWDEKVKRDQIRVYLESQKSQNYFELYYYDGHKVQLLANHIVHGVDAATEKEVAIYARDIRDKNQKILLSELRYDSESESVTVPWRGSRDVYVAVKGTCVKVDMGEAFAMKLGISSNGRTMYAVCKEHEYDNIYSLYRMNRIGKYILKPVSVAKGVDNAIAMKYQVTFRIAQESGGYELYVDFKKVASNATNIEYNDSDNALFYVVKQGDTSKLMRYKNGFVTEIGENVYGQYVVTPSGKVFYISRKEKKKTLYMYHFNQSVKIDSGDIDLFNASIYETNQDYWK